MCNCSLQVQLAPLDGLRRDESVRHARVDRCIIVVTGWEEEEEEFTISKGSLSEDAGELAGVVLQVLE